MRHALAFCLAWNALPALAQSTSAQLSGTPTRGMVVFTDLENRLAVALDKNTQADVDALLSPDFEQRNAVAPAQPLPRREWLAQAVHAAPPAISGMSVHDYGTLAIVSFASDSTVAQARTFVVDVWRNLDGKWQLQVRYSAPVPAQPVPEPERPTGKG
jgi:hypothetical protein